MGKEVTTISPEGLEIANAYLQFGNIRAVCEMMAVPENQVVELLNKREVKKYIDDLKEKINFECETFAVFSIKTNTEGSLVK